ncbi:MAG: hypothetical protein ACYDD1_04930 [Caulobacteraceae bacterium]
MNDADLNALAEGSRAEAALDYLAPIFDALKSRANAVLLASNIEHVALREKLFMYIRGITQAEESVRVVIRDAEASRIMGEHPNLQVDAANALAGQGLTRP